jgi:hypothetical protein
LESAAAVSDGAQVELEAALSALAGDVERLAGRLSETERRALTDCLARTGY